MDASWNKNCAEKECTSSFPAHKRGTMEAGRLGWFHQRNGDSWCPTHIPEWVVAEWRAKKKGE